MCVADRVSIGIHCNPKDVDATLMDRVLETYTYMSGKWFTHASPTLFNAGNTQTHTHLNVVAAASALCWASRSCFSFADFIGASFLSSFLSPFIPPPRLQACSTQIAPGAHTCCRPAGTCSPQLSSCFLLTVTDDSIDGIYETLKRCALISKTAGGIGLSIHNIRATNSYISGTNGNSNGIVPMLRVYNDTARYVDQGGGKRKGAFAIYLEPWHADIFDFLDLKKNHGKEEARARDLFYAMWTPDLFMKRVEADGEWSLFCPNEAPGMADCWGDEFEVETLLSTRSLPAPEICRRAESST